MAGNAAGNQNEKGPEYQIHTAKVNQGVFEGKILGFVMA